MELRGAVSSHVGNVRENNQDRAHFGGFIAVVADGMGGHQGGEMAASIAISEFVEVSGPIAPGGLVELVEDANRAVFEKAADPDLRGMGTTLVALTLRPTEEKVSVVNVGDSRAYFIRDGTLAQLTLDHSLVEDLVRQNRLTPDEALTHPQRNILTRALGIASQVDVDRFLVSTRIGDRFLLCSDGLFNEVDEDRITQLLVECAEPNDAADQLVSAALLGAGRDNVTVAVVDVVADGSGENVSSQAPETLLVPAAGPPDNGATGGGGGGGGATQSFEVAGGGLERGFGQGGVGVDVAEPELAAEIDDEATVDDYVDEGDGDLDHYDIDRADPFDTAPIEQPRRSNRALVAVVALLVAAVVALGAVVAVNVVVNRTWFVYITDSNQVAVYQGKPDGFLWTDPKEKFVSELSLEGLTPAAADDVRARTEFGSEDEARAFVERLERAEATPVTSDDLEGVTQEPAEPGEGSTTATTPATTGDGGTTAEGATTVTAGGGRNGVAESGGDGEGSPGTKDSNPTSTAGTSGEVDASSTETTGN